MLRSIIKLFLILSCLTAQAGPPVVWDSTCPSGIFNLATQVCLISGGGTGGITSLSGDVTAMGPGGVLSTVNLVGGSTAANVHNSEGQVNSVSFVGFSNNGFRPGIVNLTSLDATLAFIMNMQYAPPTISLSATPDQRVRENGDSSVTSVTLFAAVTKLSDNISSVNFYGGGACVGVPIHTDTSSTGSGTRSYVDSSNVGTSTFSYCANVTDTNPTTINSNIVTFPYVNPYFYGLNASNTLTPGQIVNPANGMVKHIIANTSPVADTESPNGVYWYFIYPSSYPVLTQIKDPATNIDYINSFTRTTITISDGIAPAYSAYQYVSNTILTFPGGITLDFTQ